MNLITRISSAGFIATEQQIEELARDRHASRSQAEAIDTIYHKVLLAGCLAQLAPAPSGKRRRKSAVEAQTLVLETVHQPLYAAVLRGITTPDVSPDGDITKEERKRRALARNGRSNFARSAKSTMLKFIEAGNDLRSLDVATVTKDALRAAVVPAETGDREEVRAKRAERSLLRSIARVEKVDPHTARTRLETIVGELQTRLEAMTAFEKPRRRRTDNAANESRVQ